MLTKVLAIIALATLSSVGSAKDFCAYGDTNGLVWDKQFETSVRRFFGPEKIEYFYSRRTTANQVLTGLGGPPDKLQRLDDKLVLASACRAHSCIEKAAVVIACPNTLVAVGIFHYKCGAKDREENCAAKPHLTVYSGGDNEMARDAIQSWGQAAADSYGLTLVTHDREKSGRSRTR